MEKIPTHYSSRVAAALMAAVSVVPLVPHAVQAESLVQKEIARRAAKVQEADVALYKGRSLYAEAKYEEAVTEFRKALSLLPPGPTVADRRHAYTSNLVDGSIALAQQYRKTGRYEEARQLLSDAIAKDPSNALAQQELSYLDDPIRTNPVLTPEHIKDVKDVTTLLQRAEGYYNLGKFDESYAEYEEVLRIDPFNRAARRGMEKADQAKSGYDQSAYDQTRVRLLREVDQAWAIAVPPRIDVVDANLIDTSINVTGQAYIRRKLQDIIVPLVDFQDMTVEAAIDILRLRARELDNTELDPTKKGINFVVRAPDVPEASVEEDEEEGEFGSSVAPGSKMINSLQLRNVPLQVVIAQICDMTGLRYRVEDYAVVLLPGGNYEDAELFRRSFNVPPDFLTIIGSGGGAAEEEADPFADDEDTSAGIAPTRPVKDLLVDAGVPFPDGSSAGFSKATSTLYVRNTSNNLDLVEQIVERSKTNKPKQIKIATKFVEITQNNHDELGFDWIVSPGVFNAGNLFAGGGTVGSGGARTAADFIGTVNGTSVSGVNATGNVSNIVTAGNRTGSFAISNNSLDSFINNPNRTQQNGTAAPGVLSLTGLFSSGQVQMIMRGLAQKKGADVMTAPSILARSGEKAQIEIIREFIYPTEYEPPELPNEVGIVNDSSGNGTVSGSANAFPVTPATPTAFETRNTGVTLEVEPTLGDDGYTIDLRFAPEITEFQGFINYGSPIQSSGTNSLGAPVSLVLTENRIEMPVFSTRRVTTGLTIYDGHTVALGGLMREDTQKVEDKVPVLGDLPLVGRLFRSEAERRVKSNIVVFVSVNMIDATGRSIRNSYASGGSDSSGGAVTNGVLPTN